MLRFLFSCWGTEGNAVQVDHEDEGVIAAAFGMVWDLANKSGPLRDNLGDA